MIKLGQSFGKKFIPIFTKNEWTKNIFNHFLIKDQFILIKDQLRN